MDILSDESRDSLRPEVCLLLGDGGSGNLLNLLSLGELAVGWEIRTDWCVSQGGPFLEVGAPDFSRAPKYNSEVVELRLLKLGVELLVLRVVLDLLHDLLRQDSLVELTDERGVVHQLIEELLVLRRV